MRRNHEINDRGAASGGGLVLVADDDPQVRKMLVRFLSSLGYTVIEAADGLAAIALALERIPDIVLLDLSMPGKTGLEVLKELAPGMPGTGFIIVTGNDDDEAAASCLRFGAFDYIPKPMSMSCLARSVKTWLLGRR
ncbi:MAG: response regulator [Elusimicrobia bacterium]|nr:response regulator [Elusimicrobiota bacterium]